MVDFGVAIVVGGLTCVIVGAAVALGAAREAREWWQRREVASA